MRGAVKLVLLLTFMLIGHLSTPFHKVKYYYAIIRLMRARLPMREMVESLVLELLQIKAVTKCIHVRIGYAAEDLRSTGGSRTLAQYTDSFQELCPAVLALFDKYKRPDEPIRRIAVGFEDLVNKALYRLKWTYLVML